MDLNRALVFIRVVEQGGFTAAAKLLHLPKSSVSRSVSLLEEELGVRLLTRSTRAVRLTEAGSAYYARASRGIAGIEEAALAAADLQLAVRGSIRITAPADVGVWLLGPLIARFLLLYPKIRIDTVLTGRVVDLVEEGFDLALRAGTLRDTSLIGRRLKPLAFTLHASSEYLKRRGMPKCVADVASHDCVAFHRGGDVTTWTLTGPAGDESVCVTARVTSDDLSFVRRAIESGCGIGLMPTMLGDSLVQVLPAHSVAGASFHLVYPSARYVPHRVATFRDFLLRELS